MIELTKMNYERFYINPHLIEIVENTPDTLITTLSGKKYYCLETVSEVCVKCLAYYQSINLHTIETAMVTPQE